MRCVLVEPPNFAPDEVGRDEAKVTNDLFDVDLLFGLLGEDGIFVANGVLAEAMDGVLRVGPGRQARLGTEVVGKGSGRRRRSLCIDRHA